MKLLTSLALMGLLLSASACGDDSRARGGDGGTDGSIVLMDGGGDTGTTSDSSTTSDSGGGSCPAQTVPTPTTAICSANLPTCLMACDPTDDACFNACFDGEDPMCEGCINQAAFACYTMNGCDQEYGDVICCAMDAGCGSTDAACVMTNCGTQLTAFNTCTNTVPSGACGAILNACIMSM